MGLDSVTLLKAVFESTADGLLIVDPSGKVLQSNHRFQEMWRIPDELMATRDDDKLLSFILDQVFAPDAFLSKVRELYQSPLTVSEDTITFKDGRYFRRYSQPLSADGINYGRVFSFRDITVQKKNEEVFRTLTELSPDVISILSPEGKLVMNSAAAERIHGYSSEELIGQNTLEFHHPDDRAECQAVLQQLVDDPDVPVTVQYRYRHKNGTYTWMEANGSNQIHNPLINGIVVISRDIGKRKQLEEDLNEALRIRDDFTSIVTHELKTPVTSIKLQLQILQRAGKSLHTGEHSQRSENLPAMIGQVNALERLIDDLLQVSKIRKEKLSCDMKEEDLSKIISSSTENLRSLLHDCECELSNEIESELMVVCDRQRIEQVVVNLLTNVMKYAPGKPVKVVVKKNSGMAEIRVIDQGQGIQPEKRDAIFDLFCQGAGTRRVGGLGVGLYISRSIVELHSGKIFVESTPGKGSEFVVHLPLIC
ncbi:MAG: PAS domain S-box protein [Bdellovibrionota bacterium]